MASSHRLQLEFFGAAGEVTGSCHILRIGRHQVLLDCGLVQGGRRQAARNREDFPFDPAEIDAVILSHAHIDHSGRLPLLVKRGFGGPIFCQRATRDFCRIMLEDSAGLAERDAELESRKRARKGLGPVEPVYTVADAQKALAQFKVLDYGEQRAVLPGLKVRFQDAGHILGAATVELWASDGGFSCKLVFSGDLGQSGTPILRDPTMIAEADLVLLESTYGDRLHRPRQATLDEMAEILNAANHEQGNVLIPAFAVGRTQELLYLFSKYRKPWELDRWRIFLDSPMAIRASEVYWQHQELYDEEAQAMRAAHARNPLLPNLSLTASPEESMAINRLRSGAIIIAGSGMCEGGRIVHHLKHNAWRPECHIIIVGYQARGTLGRRLVDGEAYIRVHHEAIRVRAKVHTVGGLSAHGDQNELVRWYKGFAGRPPVWLVHGETGAADALKTRLEEEEARQVTIAAPGMKLDLSTLPAVHRRRQESA